MVGGLSGSQIYRIDSPTGSFACKVWQPSMSRPYLEAIHAVLNAVNEMQPPLIPSLQRRINSSTILEDQSRLVELSEWIEGKPISGTYDRKQLQSVCKAMIDWNTHTNAILQSKDGSKLLSSLYREFHIDSISHQNQSPAPCIAQRLQIFNNWSQTIQYKHQDIISDTKVQANIEQLNSAMIEQIHTLDLQTDRLFKQCESRLKQMLDQYISNVWQPALCLVDARAEHFLFNNDQFTGLIDFGALRIDQAEIDLSRFASSLGMNRKQTLELAVDYNELLLENRSSLFDQSSTNDSSKQHTLKQYSTIDPNLVWDLAWSGQALSCFRWQTWICDMLSQSTINLHQIESAIERWKKIFINIID